MSFHPLSLLFTAMGAIFVYVVLRLFGMGLLPAGLIGLSIMSVNLGLTLINDRKQKQHDIAREARRSANLASYNETGA